MKQGWYQTSRRIAFLNGKRNENHELDTGFSVHKRIVSAFKRVEFVSDNAKRTLV
jgi:hypothetical protein